MFTPVVSPVRFPADWHPSLGPVLRFFPRQVASGGLSFWPDFATLVDDPEAAAMMYYPAQPARASVCITYCKSPGEWQTRTYEDAELVQLVRGAEFDGVMRATQRGERRLQSPLEPA